MALTFACCASLVFAQAPAKKSAPASLKEKRVESVAKVADNATEQATYKGSIFSKSVVVKPVEEFAAAASPTTYTVGTTSRHQQTHPTAMWTRVSDTSAATVASLANSYPALFGQTFEGGGVPFYSSSASNGYMVCSMQDQIAQWGGHGGTGAFDTYIEFPAFSTVAPAGETYEILDVKMYQYYRCFNADVCVIDYSVDNGATWDTVEFNLARIEVAVNSSIRGWKSVALPTSVIGNENVKIRVRYASFSNGGGAYGYFWLVDDVSVETGLANRMNVNSVTYSHGAYHLIPQGMDVNPVIWYTMFENNGAIDQTNVTGFVSTVDGTEIASSNGVFMAQGEEYVNNGSLVPEGAKSVYAVIDRNTNTLAGDDPSFLGFGLTGTAVPFPHANAGTVDIYSGLRSDSLNYSFDTLRYNVLAADENGTYVWGRDNGILSRYSTWTYGTTADGYLTSEATYSDAGYAVNIVYTPPANVPADWVIRGVELVGHTDPRYAEDVEAGIVKISPFLRYDSLYSDYVSFRPVETGAGVHTVTMDEMNFGSDSIVDYAMAGEYNTIRIMFPEQPTLRAGTQYRVGYVLEEQAMFCLATDRNFYYNSNNEGVYYRDDEDLAPYKNRFGNGGGMNVRVTTPESGGSSWLGTSAGYDVPMIRLLVGPRQEVASHTITLTWEGNGAIYSSTTYETIESDVAAEGSSRTYIIAPDSTIYEVLTITLDGQDVMAAANYDVAAGYYTYTIENITAAHTLHATFSTEGQGGGEDPDPTGINTVENNVRIALQPNPANAQTQLSIEGVDGNVNFSIIDMSGRVIASEVMNANEVKTINVSNLVKGTYFVRITNNNFTKVEKLIVR